MFSSAWSRIEKSWFIPRLKKFSLTRFRQKESTVQIFAQESKDICLTALRSPGFSFITSSSFDAILDFISAAAAFVKVTIRSRSTLTGFSVSVIICLTLSTRTAVFPEPAAAETSIFAFLAFIALLCCFVQFGKFIPPLIFLKPLHL